MGCWFLMNYLYYQSHFTCQRSCPPQKGLKVQFDHYYSLFIIGGFLDFIFPTYSTSFPEEWKEKLLCCCNRLGWIFPLWVWAMTCGLKLSSQLFAWSLSYVSSTGFTIVLLESQCWEWPLWLRVCVCDGYTDWNRAGVQCLLDEWLWLRITQLLFLLFVKVTPRQSQEVTGGF